MADVKISALNSLAGADLVAADVVAVVDDSASETKKLTVSDLIANGTTLISDATIPSAKILFAAGAIDTAELAASAVETAKINDSAVTAAKLADNSSVTLVSTLPASGDFTGQIALDTDDDKIYVWDGSAWDSVKGAGSINVVNGSTSGIVNITTSTSGDTVTVSTTLDDTTAAKQFLAGPTGAGGTVGYRAIASGDLPTATSSAKGAVAVNGNGLTMSNDEIQIDNTVTAETTEHHLVQYDANGLITAGRVIAASDLPEATSSAKGAVVPGSGLEVASGGTLNHTNSTTAGTYTKVTVDAQGHVTSAVTLAAADIPDLDAAKITTGTFPTARLADDAVTAAKLADQSVTKFSGNLVNAGTYDASTNLLSSVTTAGSAAGFTNGAALPAPASGNLNYYVVVDTSGTGSGNAPAVALAPPDMLISLGVAGTTFQLIDVSNAIAGQTAANISVVATGNIAATDVQAALQELDTEKLAKAGGTMTGNLELGNGIVIVFEGATDDGFETTLTVADPTADRTITLPNETGTLLTTGSSGVVSSAMIADGAIVNADINASAEIAVSKLANGTARQLLQTDVAGTGVEFTSNVDVPGTLDVTGAATFDSTAAVTGALTVTGVINADGKVKFPAGTASAPSFYSGTDTDTGLYFSAANEISVATGGTQRVVVDSSGQVGIGALSPSASFHISANDPAIYIQDANGTGSSINSTIQYRDSSNTQVAYFGYASASDSHFSLFNKLSGGALTFGTASTERVRVDANGLLLLGTSTARAAGGNQTRQFQIEGTTYANSSIQLTCNSTSQAPTFNFGRSRGTSVGSSTVVQDGDDLGFLTWSAADGTDLVSYAAQIHAQIDGTPGSNDTPGRLIFSTSADGSAAVAERMRIDSSGRVGIGVTPPDYGTGRVSLDLHSSGATVTHLALTNSTTGSNGASNGFNIIQNGLNTLMYLRESGYMSFSTANTERMRIDSSGRLLIGTSSAFDGGSDTLLQVLSTGGARFALARNDTTTAANDSIGRIRWYGNDSDGNYDECARIEVIADADHASNSKPSALTFHTTADSASSPTERLRISNKGVVTVKNSSVGEIDALTSASTITPDFAASNNFSVTLGTNATLANPSNLTAGQSGVIAITQDGTGSRTLAYGSKFKFAGGTAPTLTTTASAVDILTYYVESTSRITAQVLLNVS
jgi:hypothetical protein